MVIDVKRKLPARLVSLSFMNYIEMPENFLTDFITASGGIISDLLPIILMVIGVMLGLFILGEVLNLLNKNK
jgi:hypothetical protein